MESLTTSSTILFIITCLSAMSRTRLHLSATPPTLLRESTYLARRLFSGNIGAAAIAALALVILFILLLYIYAKRFLKPSSSTGDMTSPVVIPLYQTAGLSETTVSSLPCFFYDPSAHRKQYGSDCVVCLSEFDREVRVLPPCGHCFHVECIDRWLRSQANCPICRAPIDVAEESGGEIGKG